jgi:hypothetical protein
MMKKFLVLLLIFVFAAAFAQEGEGAEDSANRERGYAPAGFGDDDFSRSLRAAMRGEDLYRAGQFGAAREAFD